MRWLKWLLSRGAEVTLVSGPVNLVPPAGVHFVPVTTAREMFEAVTKVSDEQDIIIKPPLWRITVQSMSAMTK